jgi:uncharacterized protein (DUF488 family)
MSQLFSIGHGNKDFNSFSQELRSFGVDYLIDIRSIPASKWNLEFSRETLRRLTGEVHIRYVYMGDLLGGLPADSSCYSAGKVDYAKLREKDFFRRGMERLLKAHDQDIAVAIMCSESNPAECHRTKLIGVELQRQGIILQHIVGIGKEKSQQRVMDELTGGFAPVNLFGDETLFLSRKRYC